jgi:hypothetical protein
MMEFDSRNRSCWMRSDSFRASHSNADAAGMDAPSAIEAYTVIENVRA